MYIKGFVLPHRISGYGSSEAVLAALSGGADSSLLLRQLCLYSKEYGAKIYAAHLNHMIRGADADRDENFCREMCKKLNVGFFSRRVDVPSISRQTGESLETAARQQRYMFFGEIMRGNRIKILATAHNADDNLETMIFNLTRGTGISGIGGIPESRPMPEIDGGVIIRPIIQCSKAAVLEACLKEGIEYVTDSTNTDTDYSRNRIRHNVIPELEKICPSVRVCAARLAYSAKEDNDRLETEAKEYIAANRGNITACGISELHPSVAKRVILDLCRKASDMQPEACHLNAILTLCRKNIPGSSLSLPGKIRISLSESGNIVLSPDTRERKKASSFPLKSNTERAEIPIPDNGKEVCVELLGNRITVSRISKNDKSFGIFKGHLSDMNTELNIYNKSTYLLLKSDKIMGTLYARTAHTKDSILRGNIHKSVKDIMRESGVPRERRASLPVFCIDGEEETVLALPCIPGAVRTGFGVMPEDIGENTLIVKVEQIL